MDIPQVFLLKKLKSKKFVVPLAILSVAREMVTSARNQARQQLMHFQMWVKMYLEWVSKGKIDLSRITCELKNRPIPSSPKITNELANIISLGKVIIGLK